MPRATCLGEAAIGRDEAFDHRRNQTCWIGDRLAGLAAVNLSVSDKIPIDRRR